MTHPSTTDAEPVTADVKLLVRRGPCREAECPSPSAWVMLLVDPSLPPQLGMKEGLRVQWTCRDHNPGEQPDLVMALCVGEPRTCTLRPDGPDRDRCGCEEIYLALYMVGPPEGVRLGPVCTLCARAEKIALQSDEVRVFERKVLSLDELLQDSKVKPP